MLTKFAVTNYRGFKERIEWDLTKPRNFEFNTFAVNNGIVKNGIIYGPNGCGKSNFGFAIFDIVNHLTQKYTKFDYYLNFTYAGAQNKPVLFEYDFIFGEKNIAYKYGKTRQGVLIEESLFVDENEVFNRKTGHFSLDTRQFPIDKTMKRNLSDNANNVSIINYLLASYPLSQNHYLIFLRNFVDSMLWFRCLEAREFIGLDTSPQNMDEFIIRNGLVKDFSHFLKDVSGQNFDFVKPLPGDKILNYYIEKVPVNFYQTVSTGTHSLMLLYFWLKHLESASFVFIDEFDAFYHFKLAYEVCRRLFNLKCQVFMSSHNTYLMTNDLLRPDCNFILNHNKIKALCDATDKELREGHNIEKLFRGGAFDI